MTSKIKAIVPNGNWNGKYGTMYSFKVTFEDGVTIEANSKTDQPPYKVGDEMSYEITNDDPKFGAKGRVFKPEAGQYSNNASPAANGNRDAIIMKQTALKCAAEFNAQRNVTLEAVIEDAQAMFDWLLGSTPAATEAVQSEDKRLPF
jgi:hypothetical protein